MTNERKVELISLQRTATFTVEMPERAVRALRMIGDFGSDAFVRAIATILSENESRTHREGLKDLVAVGGCCASALERLEDAKDVIAGRKVAREPEQLKRIVD